MIRAHMNYVAAVNKGGDGRPDFHARKACNYAEEAIQVFPPTHLSFSIITFAQSFFGCNVLGVPIHPFAFGHISNSGMWGPVAWRMFHPGTGGIM